MWVAIAVDLARCEKHGRHNVKEALKVPHLVDDIVRHVADMESLGCPLLELDK
jgi:hypothetical protein